MNPRGYIGIDFGTNNSHLAFALVVGDQIQAEPIYIGNQPYNSSAVLWKKPAQDVDDIALFGDDAIEEWMMMEPEEKQEYILSTSFKPDIVDSERARKDAWAFLYKTYLKMRETRTPRKIGSEEGMPVVIGVPAEVGPKHKEITRIIAEKANFGTVECVEEPLGALSYHIAHEQISVEEAAQGVIVVDFGGGTLDVALVDENGVRQPWGNPTLGGRLFDDVFFQWLLDRNPKILEHCEDFDLHFGWHTGCRRLKENFSRHWENKGLEADFYDFKGRAELISGATFGILRNASLAEFKERASAYKASDVASAHFKELGESMNIPGVSEPVNLFEEIRKTLSNDGQIESMGQSYSHVILTGGSCYWPFMKELAAQTYGVSDKQLIISSRPEITIGEGLAIYNVIRHRHQVAKKSVETERDKLKKIIISEIGNLVKGFAKDVSNDIASQLISQVKPLFMEWYKNGGALKDVESKVRKKCKQFSADKIIQDRQSALMNNLTKFTRDSVSSFLKDHGMSPRSDQLSMVSAKKLLIDTSATGVDKEIGEQVAGSVTMALGGIGALIGGIISGGSGLALIASGPIGWLIGAAIAVGIVVGAKDEIEKKLKAHEFKGLSLLGLHQLISEAELEEKLAEAKTGLQKELMGKLTQKLDNEKKQLISYLNENVNGLLKRLSMLDSMSTSE